MHKTKSEEAQAQNERKTQIFKTEHLIEDHFLGT